MLPKIGELATKLNLDGLIVIFLQTGIRRAGENITWGGRGLDTIKMEPALILVTRDGKVAIDTGARTIDDLSPSNAGVPLYKVDSKGGSFGFTKERNGIIDLKEPTERCSGISTRLRMSRSRISKKISTSRWQRNESDLLFPRNCDEAAEKSSAVPIEFSSAADADAYEGR